MRKRKIYISVRNVDREFGFSFETSKSLKETREYFTKFGPLILASALGDDEDDLGKDFNALAGLFEGADAEDLFNNFEVVVSYNEDDIETKYGDKDELKFTSGKSKEQLRKEMEELFEEAKEKGMFGKVDIKKSDPKEIKTLKSLQNLLVDMKNSFKNDK